MKKLKRISAALMVILLAGLFIAAIVLAITGAPANQLMAVIFSILLWFVPRPRPYVFPLLSAMDRFSRIVMEGQVPFDGS